jgi:hypothetical protein
MMKWKQSGSKRFYLSMCCLGINVEGLSKTARNLNQDILVFQAHPAYDYRPLSTDSGCPSEGGNYRKAVNKNTILKIRPLKISRGTRNQK